MTTRHAFLNGHWIREDSLAVSVHDTGFLLGATVTERLRTFRHEIFRLDQHMARMRRALEIMALDAPRLIGQITTAISEFPAQNRDQIDKEDDWSILAFVTPGVVGSGQPTVCVHGYPLLFHTWAELYEKGIAVAISDVRQVPATCWPTELKCRSRMHYYLADLEAKLEHNGARAILLDQDGFVGEASTANVLIYKSGEGLLSPPIESVLPGVTLGVVREMATRLNIPFHERRLNPQEFCEADEVFLTSTSGCMLPVVLCDGKPIGSGKPGPIFERLLAALSQYVGLDIVAQARRFSNRTSAT
jgi:branched-subunit amino acid aminotransferase/4-amino-4-deoxychorismate lyase